MQYSTLASTLGFSRYNPNGIQLLTDGRLLLKVSERSMAYSDTVDRKYIEFSYDGHIEGRRNSRNGLVKRYLAESLDANPRVVLAIGRFVNGKKSGALAWSIDDSVVLRGVVDKGVGVSPTFVLTPVFRLEWDHFTQDIEDTEDSDSSQQVSVRHRNYLVDVIIRMLRF